MNEQKPSDFNPIAPHTWPKLARRIFVIGFPITVPLWMIGSAAILLVIIIAVPLVLVWKGEP